MDNYGQPLKTPMTFINRSMGNIKMKQTSLTVDIIQIKDGKKVILASATAYAIGASPEKKDE